MLFLSALSFGFAQTPVTVCDQTIKIGGTGEENLYYGFAEGDQIILEFESDKELKEIQVFELVEKNSSQKYSNFKATSAQTTIYVPQKAVYQFRFKNGAVAGRICKIKIQRIPESEATQRFNTGWKFKTLYDTTYVPYTQDSLVGYDSLWYKETVREEISSYLVEEDLLPGGRPITIRSEGIIQHDNPREFVQIRLPQNENTTYMTKKVKAWAYWIGVGPTAESFFSKNKDAVKSSISTIAGITNPIAGLAVGAVTDLIIPSGETIDPVRYAITDYENKGLFMTGNTYSYIDYGFGKGGTGRFTNQRYCQGTYYICLKNDNIHDRIDVTVKAIAVIEVKEFQDVEYDRVKVTPRYVTLHKKRMVVNTTQIRVNAQ